MPRPKKPYPSVVERFWSKIVRQPTGCWEWTAARSRGYGTFAVTKKKLVGAHRYSYELLVEPITLGMTIDHLCRNKVCVNPSHLEVVTSRENTRRAPNSITTIHANQTHCKWGHPFNEKNTYWDKQRGGRACRPCQINRRRERLAKAKLNG